MLRKLCPKCDIKRDVKSFKPGLPMCIPCFNKLKMQINFNYGKVSQGERKFFK